MTEAQKGALVMLALGIVIFYIGYMLGMGSGKKAAKVDAPKMDRPYVRPGVNLGHAVTTEPMPEVFEAHCLCKDLALAAGFAANAWNRGLISARLDVVELYLQLARKANAIEPKAD